MPIVTLNDVSKKGGSSSSGQSDGKNEYYAGGASADGGSSVALLGPNDKNNNSGSGNNMSSVLKKAETTMRSGAGSQPGSGAGDSNTSNEIHVYADGFTIGLDGPLRPSSDPHNMKLLNSIATGNLPTELRNAFSTTNESSNGNTTGEVFFDVKLVDHSDMQYADRPQPKKKSTILYWNWINTSIIIYLFFFFFFYSVDSTGYNSSWGEGC